jgi:hypothetical protein
VRGAGRRDRCMIPARLQAARIQAVDALWDVRACFICGCTGACGHREPEVAEAMLDAIAARWARCDAAIPRKPAAIETTAPRPRPAFRSLEAWTA